MNYIAFTHFPGGRSRCLTFSYDDGRVFDRQLVEIFNKYNVKGTFHLNSPGLGGEKSVTREEVPTLYAGHEVACHAVHHPFMDNQPDAQIIREVMEDRTALEELAGYPVRGMSYPYGAYNTRVVEVLKSTGIVYNRTTGGSKAFTMPDNWLVWRPTCHHRDLSPELTEKFLNPDRGLKRRGLIMYYVWGHSYEFDTNDNWNVIDEFCAQVSGNDDVWYATNIEIYDYVTALHRLEFSALCDMVYNPSAQPVWITVNQEVVEIAGGETKKI